MLSAIFELIQSNICKDLELILSSLNLLPQITCNNLHEVLFNPFRNSQLRPSVKMVIHVVQLRQFFYVFSSYWKLSISACRKTIEFLWNLMNSWKNSCKILEIKLNIWKFLIHLLSLTTSLKINLANKSNKTCTKQPVAMWKLQVI